MSFAWLLLGVLLGGGIGYLDGYWHAVVDLMFTEKDAKR